MKTKLYIILTILAVGSYFALPLLSAEDQKQNIKRKDPVLKKIKTSNSPKKPQAKTIKFDLQKKVKENFLEIHDLKILTANLRQKLSKIENKDLMPQILWHFFQLEDEVQNGLDVKKSLLRLQILTKKDDFLQDKFTQLEKELKLNYISQKQFLQNFINKIPSLIASDNSKDGLVNKIKLVMAKYISIRKTKFTKSDLKSNEFLIFQTQKAIKEQNYSFAIGLIKKFSSSQQQIIGQETLQLQNLNNVNKILTEVRFYLKDFKNLL
jgi:hypothetical protein